MARHRVTPRKARRRTVRKIAKAIGPKFKVKTARRLTESQRKRAVGETFAKINIHGKIKTRRVKGRELIPQFIIVAPKRRKKRPPKPPRLRGTPSL